MYCAKLSLLTIGFLRSCVLREQMLQSPHLHLHDGLGTARHRSMNRKKHMGTPHLSHRYMLTIQSGNTGADTCPMTQSYRAWLEKTLRPPLGILL